MSEFFSGPWLGWAIALAIGLPVVLVALTELGGALARRGNPAAKPVIFLRNFVLPVGGLLALLALASDVRTDFTWIKVTATVFGFLVILLLLSGVNVVMFGRPAAGSWRDRMPSIFVDLVRLLLIVLGLALLFWWVWGADVGGIFTALGVTSIVIGLALQNAVGSVISGLLLLVEQPFKIGDWLNTGSGKGRVVEVNWRAVHIETPDGTLVMPTASLAGSAFTNLSAPSSEHAATVDLSFGVEDAPHSVSAMLVQVASDLPMADRSRRPGVTMTGPGAYSLTIPVYTPADEDDARSLFLASLWYATTRRGLHWSGGPTTVFSTPERVAESLQHVARLLALPLSQLEEHADRLRLDRYAAGEVVQRAGDIPSGLRFITEGVATMSVPLADGGELPVEALDSGDYLGQTTLTREAVPATVVAVSPLTVLYVPLAVAEDLVAARPALGTLIGSAIDARKKLIADAVGAIAAPMRRLSDPPAA